LNNLAPICLPTYSRLNHLKLTISALSKNNLAKNSELYIFSDAAKCGDENKIERLRKYLDNVDGFLRINIIKRKTNGYLKNIFGGIDYLMDKFGKIIFLEDDIVTAPSFLDFMNHALNFYKNNKDILSVTGYSPPIKAKLFCDSDVFFLPRFNAWGFGMWIDRYKIIDYFDKIGLNKVLSNRKLRSYILRYIGEDALIMLQQEAEGEIDALDVRAIYQQIFTKKLTVYPKSSLVQNIGHDGSGMHCINTKKYNTELWMKSSFILSSKAIINEEIVEAHRNFRKIDRKLYLVYLAKRYHIYKLLRSLKSALKISI
jgi:hypothetical protein